MKKGTVVKTPEAVELPYSTEQLAESIMKISEAMKILNQSKLKRKTLLVLLSHETKISQREIDYVLNTLEQLAEIYLKK